MVCLTTKRPPSEPPPSLEKITPHIDDNQWVDDVVTTAADSLSRQDTHNATVLSTYSYTPRIHKLTSNKEINYHHLSLQRHHNTHHRDKVPLRCTMQPPIVYPIHIPTPKLCSNPQVHKMANNLHNTTWKDDPSQHWKPDENSTWVPQPKTPQENRLTPDG